MNKQQRKILLTKILPKFIIVTLVILGIITFFGIKILGAKAEKEADEFWSNPKNKEKIENAINKNKNTSNPITEQNTYIDKPDNQKYKTINKLKFPIPKGWGIKTDVHETSIDLFNVIFENYDGNGIISIMSRKHHEYIKDLEDYSNYQNEKLIRNMKPTDLILTSDGIIIDKYLGIDAVYLSEYIVRNKKDYYNKLREVTENNDWESWILYMLEMVEYTAKKGLQRLKDVTDLMHLMTTEIKKVLPTVYTKELVEILFRLPYTKRQFLIDEKLGTPKTVGNYLMALEEAGFLISEKVGKEKLYLNYRLMAVLEQS